MESNHGSTEQLRLERVTGDHVVEPTSLTQYRTTGAGCIGLCPGGFWVSP